MLSFPSSITDSYESFEKIGYGSFSTVYKAKHKQNGESYAIKVIDLNRLKDKKERERVLYEIEVMKVIQNKNIVRMYHVVKHEQDKENIIFLVLEYCGGGDLHDFLSKQPGRKLTEEHAKYYIKQFADGLKFLRKKNILHRDLKPQNLLLTSGDLCDGMLKIADFGFAKYFQNDCLTDTKCGSPMYMAPEVLIANKYSSKCDLWSVGIILYQILTGFTPYHKCRTQHELTTAIKKQIIPPLPDSFSKDMQNLVSSLLQKDPYLRITWDEFFDHPVIVKEEFKANAQLTLGNIPRSKPVIIKNNFVEQSYYYTSSSPLEGRQATLLHDYAKRSPVTPPSYINSPPGKLAKYTPFDSNKLYSQSLKSNLSAIDELLNSFVFVKVDKEDAGVDLIINIGEMEEKMGNKLYSVLLYMKAIKLSSDRQPERIREKLGKCKSLLAQMNKTKSINKTAEQLILDYAIHFGKEGALLEFYNRNEQSLSYYENGLLLIKQMLLECKEDQDKKILMDFITAFNGRVEKLRQI